MARLWTTLGLLAASAGAKRQTSSTSVVYYSNDDGLITASPSSNGDIVSTVFPGDGKISYIAFDGSDEMYFTDRSYNTLSKMAIAGGKAKATVIHDGFEEPHDFVLASNGDGVTHVYVADKLANAVVRGDVANMTGATAIVKDLDGPVGVATDGEYLYVAENSVGINHWSRPAWDIFIPLYLA